MKDKITILIEEVKEISKDCPTPFFRISNQKDAILYGLSDSITEYLQLHKDNIAYITLIRGTTTVYRSINSIQTVIDYFQQIDNEYRINTDKQISKSSLKSKSLLKKDNTKKTMKDKINIKINQNVKDFDTYRIENHDTDKWIFTDRPSGILGYLTKYYDRIDHITICDYNDQSLMDYTAPELMKPKVIDFFTNLVAAQETKTEEKKDLDNAVCPKHYHLGPPLEEYQVIDVIIALGIGEDFCAGNVIKYLSRFKEKNGLEDLKKAQWYLEKLIESKEGKKDE